MTDWQNTPTMKAAALEGVSENQAYSPAERLRAAQQAIALLREHIEAMPEPTDINLVRRSLDNFFGTMIRTLSESNDSGEQRIGRFLETAHKHALLLPGIAEPDVLRSDDDPSTADNEES